MDAAQGEFNLNAIFKNRYKKIDIGVAPKYLSKA